MRATTVRKQYTAEIVQFDHAGKTIDETSISAATDADGIAQAREWGRKVCADRGIGQARLKVLWEGEIQPIFNRLVF